MARKFKYKARSAAQVKKRATQGGGSRENFVKDGIKFFSPKPGENTIRILPPTWDGPDGEAPESFGLEVYVHYGIGPDRSTYLCLDRMKREACPICEERARAEADGRDEEQVRSLRANKRVATFIIDRKSPEEGVKLWSMPWTVEKDISLASTDRDTGETLEIDNPDEGYDIHFNKEGEKTRTRYSGITASRRASSLDNEEWMDFVEENPIPQILQWFSYEHISGVFNVSSTTTSAPAATQRVEQKTQESSEDTPDVSENETASENTETKPELSWAAIHEMSGDALDELVAEEKLNLDGDDFAGDDEFASAICVELGITKPRRSRRSKTDAQDNLKKLRSR